MILFMRARVYSKTKNAGGGEGQKRKKKKKRSTWIDWIRIVPNTGREIPTCWFSVPCVSLYVPGQASIGEASNRDQTTIDRVSSGSDRRAEPPPCARHASPTVVLDQASFWTSVRFFFLAAVCHAPVFGRVDRCGFSLAISSFGTSNLNRPVRPFQN